jgi:predicted Fe-Mo cluster-binding NifX family protein
MKVAVTATGKDLDSQIDPRFGRCQYFILVDTKTMKATSIDNGANSAAGGAGIKAAQTVINEKVEAVITGNVGPNAFDTLAAADVKIYINARGTVKESVDQFIAGKLQEAGNASVDSHAGMGGGSGAGRGHRQR